MSGSLKFRNPEAYTARELTLDTPCECRGLYVSAAGDLEFVPKAGQPAITVAVEAGTLPWFIHQVNSAGTTAVVTLGLD